MLGLLLEMEYGMLKPYYQDEWVTQYCSDALTVLTGIGSDTVDLLVTDPPYGIGFMGKDWDKFNEVVSPGGAYQHKKGFKKLPRQNTASMMEFFVPIWIECLRVLKAGAFAFVYFFPHYRSVLGAKFLSVRSDGFHLRFTECHYTPSSALASLKQLLAIALAELALAVVTSRLLH